MYQFHRRNDDALLKDFSKSADAGRRPAADINMMREVGDVAKELILMIHGRYEGDVVEMDTAPSKDGWRGWRHRDRGFPGTVFPDGFRHRFG